MTLVEVALALAVVAVLVAIALPLYSGYQYRGQVVQATNDITSLAAQMEIYYHTHQQYPASLADIGADTRVDPWGFPYQYINHALVNGNGHVRRDRSLNPLNSDYDLYSVGRDGVSKYPITQSESLDDVIRAQDGQYYGLASDF